MSSKTEDSTDPKKIRTSCGKSYSAHSFVLTLENCNHYICKVCLYDGTNEDASRSCPSCQSPIAHQELEMMQKCMQDTSCSLPDASYEKIYKSSGGVLVRKVDDVTLYLAVLQKRFDSDMQWVSPKGRLEGVETSLEAAKREISEEVGLESLTLIDFVCQQCYSFKEMSKIYKKTVFWYLFNVDEPNELKLNEEEGFVESKWLSFEDCLKTFSHETFVEIIKMANSMLKE